jgi:dienelactone hydrolase
VTTQTLQGTPTDPREAERAELRSLLGCDRPAPLVPAAESAPPVVPVAGAAISSGADRSEPAPSAAPALDAVYAVQRPGAVERGEIAPAGRDPFPALLVRPTPRRATGAAVVLVPGHGAGMRALVGPGDAYHGAIVQRLADRGITVLVPEMISFGERRTPPAPGAEPYGPAESSCAVDAARHLLHGTPVLGARVADASAAAAALRALPGIDPLRVGVAGGSGGGAVALLLAAVDTAIPAALVANFFSSFAASIAARPHCPCNIVPGLLPAFEMADIAALLAPRTLVLEAGEADPLFPIAAARESFARLEGLWAARGPDGADAADQADVAVLERDRGTLSGHPSLVVSAARHRLVGEESVDLLAAALA